MARQRNVLLLLLVAVLAVFAFVVADWVDDLRPKAGEHSSDDSDYRLIEINTPAEEMAKFSVNEFNDRRLGPRVRFVRRRVPSRRSERG